MRLRRSHPAPLGRADSLYAVGVADRSLLWDGPLRRWHPTQVVVVGFIAVILTGAALLHLPIATDGVEHSFLDRLFTATSAGTVTGLQVVATATLGALVGFVALGSFIEEGRLQPDRGKLLGGSVLVIATRWHEDDLIGKLIAQAMSKVGKEGVITVEENKANTTDLDVVEQEMMTTRRPYARTRLVDAAREAVAARLRAIVKVGRL